MDYAEETLTTELVAEASALMDLHKQELCAYEDWVLAPNWEGYFILAGRNQLKVYTAREKDELLGYAVYAVHPHMHYTGVMQANQDVLFIHPGRRGVLAGVGLINFADKELYDFGVHVVAHHVKLKFDFSPILERAGYVQIEKIYEKRLDKWQW